MKNILREIRYHRNPFGSAKSNLRLLLVICSVIFITTTGCNFINKHNSSSSGGGSTDSGEEPVQAQPTFERELSASSSPRSFEYANLQFTLTKGVISNRLPDARQADNSNSATAEITFSIVNTLKDSVRIQSGLWQLRLGDGSVYKQPFSETVDPRDTKERKINFPVPSTARWTGAQLVLDEQGKEPATLLLDGIAPPPQYPLQLAAGGEAATKEPQMIYTVKDASLQLNSFGERAELGKLYLNLTVHVADKESSDHGEFLPEFFRLLVNGEPLLPKNTGDDSTIESQSTQNYTMAYLIPANVTNVELEVGKPGVQTTAKIPIELKKIN